MNDRYVDPVVLKKKILLPHLNFVETMMAKTKGTRFEEQWQKMHECITCDKKQPSYEKIKQIEGQLIELQNRSKQKISQPQNSSSVTTNQSPSTSREATIKNQSTPTGSNADRDPRKRAVTDLPQTIYKLAPKEYNQPNSTPNEPRFNENSRQANADARFSDRYNPRFRGQPNSRPFLNRKFSQRSRFRGNTRHSSVFPERTRYSDVDKDDSFYKRKRSQSPAVNRTMPKRRFSSYDDKNNDGSPVRYDRSKSREKERIDDRISSSGDKITDKPSTSKTVQKSTDKISISDANDKTSLEQIKIRQSIDSKKLISNNFQESKDKCNIDDVNLKPLTKIDSSSLATAVKKIQSFKIPKIGTVLPSDQKKALIEPDSASEVEKVTSAPSKTSKSALTAEVVEMNLLNSTKKLDESELTKTDIKQSIDLPSTVESLDKNESKPELKEENPSTSLKSSENNKTASLLSSLLNEEDENPEKILEGLMSVLGSDKLKKMKELLLKNEIKEDEKKSNENTSIETLGQLKKEGIDKELENKKADSNNADDTEMKTVLKSDEENDKLTAKDTSINDTSESIPTLDTSNVIKTEAKAPVVKKKAKRKMTELDKLHRDILNGPDYEGIIRACIQPRKSIKPNSYGIKCETQVSKSPETPPKKVPKTKPCVVELKRLDLSLDEMPVKVSEFEQPKSRPGPKSMKHLLHMDAGITLNIDKNTKPITAPETNKKPDSKVEVDSNDNKTKLESLMKPNNNQAKKLIDFPAKNVLIRKKPKNFLWKRGILKKKAKKLLGLHSNEWEDIESSDENVTYETTMKLSKFKNLLNEFALKCAVKKTFARSVIKPPQEVKNSAIKAIEPETQIKDSVDSTNASELPVKNVTIEESKSDEATIQKIPKKLMLPLDKNMLDMIAKSCTNKEDKSLSADTELKTNETLPIRPSENKPKITLPLRPNASTGILPTISDRNDEEEASKTDPNARPLPYRPANQKIVMVKPLAREMIELKKVISPQEREALIAKLNAGKAGVRNSANVIDHAKLSKLPLSINKTIGSKVSVEKLPGSTLTENEAPKNVPKILNVTSISSTNEPSKSKLIIKEVNTVESSENISTIDEKLVTNNSVGESKTTPAKSVESTITSSENSGKETSEKPPEVVPSASSMNNVEVVELIDDDDDDILDVMRPWIEKTEFKSKKTEIEAIKMITSLHCLASLFKCMSSTCRYYTNDKKLFEYHLKLHSEHQRSDSLNYLLCSYCSFRATNIPQLANHVDEIHSYAKFGCKYCFYRSVNEYQVTANHHSNFHRNKEKCVVVFESKRYKSETIEKNYISEMIPKVCLALICPYCRTGIYTVKQFENHLLCHRENNTTVCRVCKLATNKQNLLQHLFKCFSKFGNFQCVYCIFGTCNFSTIDSHLSNEHPDNLSYFAERTLNFGKDPNSVESLTVKELSKKITGNVKKIMLSQSFDNPSYRNADNVGRLSRDLIIRRDENEQNLVIEVVEKPDSNNRLLIGEVVSLHN